jgi:hypothetical protein
MAQWRLPRGLGDEGGQDRDFMATVRHGWDRGYPGHDAAVMLGCGERGQRRASRPRAAGHACSASRTASI